MKGFNLSSAELAELKRAHKSEYYKRSAYKINCIILLGSGWTLEEVKAALLLDEETLRNYVQKYESGGLDALLKVEYKGSEPQLSVEEIQQLCDALDTQIFLTTKSVIDYINNEFDIAYSSSGMRDLLHRLNYEYKKPKLVPANPNNEAQEIFAQQYEKFMEKKPDNVEVLFMDAVHPQHNTMAAYGWIKRGEERRIKTSSGRERLNLHGAMNAETFELTVIESETVNDDSTIQLLETVENKYAYAIAIYIILDNAKYHFSRKVRRFLESSRIKLVFLPSYSPNLNLIERLWRFFKKKVLYNTYYEKIEDFRGACIEFFRNIHLYRHELIPLMGGGLNIARFARACPTLRSIESL
jgi:transposase